MSLEQQMAQQLKTFSKQHVEHDVLAEVMQSESLQNINNLL
jgi:hypothetical protein